MVRIQIEGPGKERRIVELEKVRSVIGRVEGCDVVIPHPTVSKRHAEIVFVKEGIAVRDLGSVNGTYVNGVRLKTPALIRPGDRLRVGRFEIVVLPGEAEKETDRSRFLVLSLSVSVAVLLGVVVLLLLMLLRRGGGEETVVSGKPIPEKEQAATGKPEPGNSGVAEVERITGEIPEGVLRLLFSKCFSCHNGTHGGDWILYQGFARKTGDLLNLRAMEPYVKESRYLESPLLLKAKGELKHGGGKILSGEEESLLADFLGLYPRILERCGSVPVARPPFPCGEIKITAAEEIRLRKVFLDLVGRPPREKEIAEYAGGAFKEIVGRLVGTEEYRSYWKGRGGEAISAVWNEKQTVTLRRSEIVEKLSSLYEERLRDRAPRRKSPRQTAASLAVDLWGRVPSAEELDLFQEALRAVGTDLLPLAAFMLGEVRVGRDRERWIERVYVRFLMRPPRKAETAAAVRLLEGEGGAESLVLGLCGSGEYYAY